MIKVLIAEDEEGILYSISNAFSWENMGCEIIGLAQNGIQALEYSLSTPPDIVISDIVMPGIDGITFLRYLKEKYPRAKIAVLFSKDPAAELDFPAAPKVPGRWLVFPWEFEPIESNSGK